MARHTVKELVLLGASASVMTGWRPAKNFAGCVRIRITKIANAGAMMILLWSVTIRIITIFVVAEPAIIACGITAVGRSQLITECKRG